ncbi:hypothetical protein [Olleya sp. YS]|uniref:hypothetical protein n=1 Tax=Olleya sp. YS TaxID=3028318 RepID=UPI0024344E15|nr:hypothetical protein [Olleya sp. YS]WGD35388.1 hypothetical protein Ollyesu_03025 [Olleya sp. YS]
MKNLKLYTAVFALGFASYTTQAQDLGDTDNATISIEAEVVGLSNWSSYNTIAKQMETFEKATATDQMTMLRSWKPVVQTLDDTRPNWINTEEINEDIADFQKEYFEAIENMSATSNDFNEDVEELVEAYNDMTEEANEIFDEYVKINREAYNNYKKEVKDGNYKEAQKQYKEDVKELTEVREVEK